MSNNPSTIPRGNLQNGWVLAVAFTPAAAAPNTSAEQTFTVQGLKLGDFVDVNKPTAQAGLTIGGTRVTAKDTLGITFGNLTAATITPTAAESYTIQVNRPENLTSANLSNLGQPF